MNNATHVNPAGGGPDPKPLAPKREHPLRIALADDDLESLELMLAILRRPDIVILTATSGAELVVLLAEHGPFHLVITDIDMPWAEGLDVVRAARASQFDVPVLFISGLARPGLAASVAKVGRARLLPKPISASGLRNAVTDLLAEAS
jgi:two-component system cell cycle response regulator CpdR